MQKLFIVVLFLIVHAVLAISGQEETTCPDAFVGYLQPRLQADDRGRVIGDTLLNVRPQPDTTQARVGELRSGTNFNILAEPRCSEGYVWWLVEAGEISGWVAEGNAAADEYWLEPRGDLVLLEQEDGSIERYVRTESGFLEPEGCITPPDDYERVQLGYATLNQRTLFMLDQAQRIYDETGRTAVNFRQLITQGSYNPGGVSASFGTHDAGGAVDISVRNPLDFSVMQEELLPMIRALRIAGFAAWVRETGELYANSPIHIHAIAIGDAEASSIARQQVSAEFGYLYGFNGLPPENGAAPYPDRYGEPIICEWMVALGFEDQRAIPQAQPDHRLPDGRG